jgi:hypothetical protein
MATTDTTQGSSRFDLPVAGTQGDQFQGGGSPSILNVPAGANVSDLTPKYVTIGTAKPAVTKLNAIQNDLTNIDTGLLTQEQKNNEAKLAQSQADAASKLTTDETAAKNKLSASLDKASGLVNGYDASLYNLPMVWKQNRDANGNPTGAPVQVSATISANGQVLDAEGKPIGNADQYLKPTTDTIANEQATIQAGRDEAFNKMVADTEAMKNGTLPLTADQLAQVNELQRQFDSLKKEQAVYNQNYEGGTNIASIVSGRSRYAPEIAMGQLMAAQSAGIAKIADIDAKAANAISQLKQGFRESNYKLIESSYNLYNDYQKEKADTLQKQLDAAATAASDLRKWNYDTVEKPKNDILTDLAKNNAPGEILSAVSRAKNVAEAIGLAGDWLQTGTGVIGEYLQYKRDAKSAGQAPMDFTSYRAAEDARIAKAKTSEAYAVAYATAKAKADVEGSGTTGVYKAGADQVVDSWAERIQSGQSKITDIPASQADLRNQVAVALAAMGNSLTGKPTTTEMGKAALATAKQLQGKITEGKGTGAVGASRFYGAGALTSLIPGSAQFNLANDFKSLKSQLSLEGVKYLKGQGQVSDAERAMLAQAVTKLDLSQSEEEFNTTLQGIIDKLEGNIEDTPSVVTEEKNAEESFTVSYPQLTPDEQAKADQMISDGVPYIQIMEAFNIQ